MDEEEARTLVPRTLEAALVSTMRAVDAHHNHAIAGLGRLTIPSLPIIGGVAHKFAFTATRTVRRARFIFAKDNKKQKYIDLRARMRLEPLIRDQAGLDAELERPEAQVEPVLTLHHPAFIHADSASGVLTITDGRQSLQTLDGQVTDDEAFTLLLAFGDALVGGGQGLVQPYEPVRLPEETGDEENEEPQKVDAQFAELIETIGTVTAMAERVQKTARPSVLPVSPAKAHPLPPGLMPRYRIAGLRLSALAHVNPDGTIVKKENEKEEDTDKQRAQIDLHGSISGSIRERTIGLSYHIADYLVEGRLHGLLTESFLKRDGDERCAKVLGQVASERRAMGRHYRTGDLHSVWKVVKPLLIEAKACWKKEPADLRRRMSRFLRSALSNQNFYLIRLKEGGRPYRDQMVAFDDNVIAARAPARLIDPSGSLKPLSTGDAMVTLVFRLGLQVTEYPDVSIKTDGIKDVSLIAIKALDLPILPIFSRKKEYKATRKEISGYVNRHLAVFNRFVQSGSGQ